MASIKIHLQQNIAFIRSHKNMTYKVFAEAIGCNESQAKTYELQGVIPPPERLCRIADFADITVDVLLRSKLTTTNILSYSKPAVLIKEIESISKAGFAITNKLAELQHELNAALQPVNKKVNKNFKRTTKTK